MDLEALLINAKDLDSFCPGQDHRREGPTQQDRGGESSQEQPGLWVHLPRAQGTPGPTR